MWKADNPLLKALIVLELEKGEKNWTELWDSISTKSTLKSKSTLSLYLRDLEAKGHVHREERRDGRRRIYYLLKDTKLTRKIIRRRKMWRTLLQHEERIRELMAVKKVE